MRSTITIIRPLIACAVFLASPPQNLSAKTTPPKLDKPTIVSQQYIGTNVVLTTRLPGGLKSVTLESRRADGLGAWKPRDVRRLNGKPVQIVFRIPKSKSPETFRLAGSSTDKLPANFFNGKKSFNAVTSSAQRVPGVFAPGTARSGLADLTASPTSSGATPAPSRDVVESDIWKISGDRLYYFNQYRGLQILNIASPDNAALVGSLDFPAAGEQMYLLGNFVVLLTRDACSGNSEISIVDVSRDAPRIVSQLGVPGSIQESRLVGTALYVASQTYGGGRDAQSDGWGTSVASFDLANPAAPVPRETLWLPGYGNVVVASENFLLVTVENPEKWWQSNIKLIDVASPDGAMRLRGSVTAAGRVADKFKVNISDSILSVISEEMGMESGNEVVQTILETFSLRDPASPVKLGQLAFASGERLFATRFDAQRVYVVTYQEIDPLWIVDLSDPTHPQLTGRVDVPGYSTYIQPFGNRLVTIGQDGSNGWRVAVSLFDVSHPASPALLSSVVLGQHYSWSEANWDEKAFKIVPEAGLILVPYEGSTDQGYAARVQLIDWKNDALALRGAIDHTLQPRRATLIGDRIISISGWEYLAVNAADRDHPVVTRNLTLAWPVDRLVLHGDYVLEFGTIGFRNDQSAPAIRVSPANSPNQLVTQWSLGEGAILGTTTKNDLLYVLQGHDPVPAVGIHGDSLPVTNSVSLTVLDLGRLPDLQIVGRTETVISNSINRWNVKALWPSSNLVVWVSESASWFFPLAMNTANPAAARVTVSGSSVHAMPIQPGAVADRYWIGPPWFYGGGGGTAMFAFDVSDSAAPRFASEFNVDAGNWSMHSEALATNGLVYLSHTRFDSIRMLRPGPARTPTPDDGATQESERQGATEMAMSNPRPQERTNHWEDIWVNRYFMDVVDYADPANPTSRDPVNISGSIAGLSHDGNVIYTVSPHNGTDGANWLDALSYDGVHAALIASLHLSTGSHPVVMADPNIFTSESTEGTNSSLAAWTLSNSGKFTLIGRRSMDAPTDTLALFGSLLVAQIGNRLDLLDASDPRALNRIGDYEFTDCFWINLDQAAGILGRGLWLPLGDYGVRALIP